MKRLRILERATAHHGPDPSGDHDWRDHLDLLEDVDPVDSLTLDMSGDTVRRALGVESDPVEDGPPSATVLTDDALSWLGSVPPATSTTDLAAFLAEGESPARRPVDSSPTWVVPIEELAEMTGPRSASRRRTVAPDLEIDWDAVPTLSPEADRGAGGPELLLRPGVDRRPTGPSPMSAADLDRLREILRGDPPPPPA